MAYCTNTEVKVFVGTKVSDADLTAMITLADKEINEYLKRADVTPATCDATNTASIHLTRSYVLERFHLTGEAPVAYNSGDWQQSGSIDTLGAAKYHRDAAFSTLDNYIAQVQTGTVIEDGVLRCDSELIGLTLDNSYIPTFGEEDVE